MALPGAQPASGSASGAPVAGLWSALDAPEVATGPGLAGQLLSVLSPLQSAPGGSASVVLRLFPAGLGSIRATVATTPGAVSVSLVADTQAGHDALAASLAQLHEMLSSEANHATTVDLHFVPAGGREGAGQAGSQGRGQAGAQPGAGASPGTGQDTVQSGALPAIVSGGPLHVVDIHI